MHIDAYSCAVMYADTYRSLLKPFCSLIAICKYIQVSLGVGHVGEYISIYRSVLTRPTYITIYIDIWVCFDVYRYIQISCDVYRVGICISLYRPLVKIESKTYIYPQFTQICGSLLMYTDIYRSALTYVMLVCIFLYIGLS